MRAGKGLEELLLVADSVFVLDLGNLLEIMPKDLPLVYVYSTADQFMAEVIRNLYERVCRPSVIHLDYGDLRSILGRGGYGTFLFKETHEHGCVNGVCCDCRTTLLGNIPISEITGCIVLIEGHYAGLCSSEQIAAGISYCLQPCAEVIWGADEDHSIPEGEVRVFVLFSTGKKTYCKGIF